MHILGYVMISGTWNPGFQDPRSALELASFDWFQHVGYESHSIYVKDLEFQSGIPKFYPSWNLPGITGTLELLWKWSIFFQNQSIEYFSNSVFGIELDFQCGIQRFHHSWNLPGIIWNPGISLEMAYYLLDFWILHSKSSIRPKTKLGKNHVPL